MNACRLFAIVLAAGLMCGCHAKQEYSCAVRLNSSAGQVTLAIDQAREWHADPAGSAFGAFEKTTARAEAQCVSNVSPYLSAPLTQQYPDGKVACTCTETDVF